jgi:hypothetical protein
MIVGLQSWKLWFALDLVLRAGLAADINSEAEWLATDDKGREVKGSA